MLVQLLLTIAPLLVIIGFVVYWLFRSYRQIEQYPQTKYHLLSGTTLPEALSELQQKLERLGFHYLASYAMELPPVFLRKAPDSYVFIDEQGTTKAYLALHRSIKSASFQTMFPDNFLVVTSYGLPASPFMRLLKDDRLQVNQVNRSLEDAHRAHAANVESQIPAHGEPLAHHSALELLTYLDKYIAEHGQQGIAQRMYNVYRGLAIVTFVLSACLVCSEIFPMLTLSEAKDMPGGYSWIPLSVAPSVLIGCIPLWFAFRVRRNYLQNPKPL